MVHLVRLSEMGLGVKAPVYARLKGSCRWASRSRKSPPTATARARTKSPLLRHR